MASAASDRHLVIFPTPGMGHLIPLVQFAQQLVNRHGFTATFIIPTDGPLSAAQAMFLDALPPGIDYLLLPAVSLDDLPQDTKIETRICLTVARSIPALRDAVKSLIAEGKKNVLAFVADLFGADALEVSLELGLPPYIFFPSGGMVLSLFLHLPELDKAVDCEYGEMSEKLRIPGCPPIHGKDLLDPLQDRKNDAYKWLLHSSERYGMAEGIILNSFKDMEPGPIETLLKQEPGKPSVYPVGPLIRLKAKSDENPQESPCLNWLSEQANGSVVFVSFGSGGTLSHDQIIELAHGLEISGQKFLWVLRCPNSSSNAAYFRIQNPSDPLSFLPEGFVERTRHRGLVVPSWAPQADILAHPSTGAFLTHCGWNSILESVVNGIPAIAWPLFAEQKMNAVMLHEVVKIALRPSVAENGLVERAEIAEVIKMLMEGEEGARIRSTARDLKDSAARALADGGASVEAIGELARKWIGTS